MENANLTDPEAFEEMRKLAVYAIDQAPGIWLPGMYFYTAWWPWVKNYHGDQGGRPSCGPDPGPCLDRSGNEEEDGI